MVPLPDQSVRAIRGTPEERAAWTAWLTARGTVGAPGLQTLKDAPRVAVYAANVRGRDVVLKCHALSTLSHRAYAAARASRGARQWRGAARLARLGIDAATPLALLRGRSGDDRVEVLVMERLPGRTVLEHLARGGMGARAEHRVAEAIARQCVAMARAGVFNRDHKPSNLVVTLASADAARVAVLDTVAVRRLHRPAGLAGVPLERVVLEAIGVGATPRKPLIARFVRDWVAGMTGASGPAGRSRRRDVWRVLAARVAAHGDPTPVDDPLSAGVK